MNYKFRVLKMYTLLAESYFRGAVTRLWLTPFGSRLPVVMGGFGGCGGCGWCNDHFATISAMQSLLMSVCVCPCIILEIFHPAAHV